MRILRYLGSLIKNDSGNSSKSFALIASSIMSIITSLVVCYVLIYDVSVNGYLKTDVESLGIFILCVGSSTAASGIPKIFGERSYSKQKRRKEIYSEAVNNEYGRQQEAEEEFYDP